MVDQIEEYYNFQACKRSSVCVCTKIYYQVWQIKYKLLTSEYFPPCFQITYGLYQIWQPKICMMLRLIRTRWLRWRRSLLWQAIFSLRLHIFQVLAATSAWRRSWQAEGGCNRDSCYNEKNLIAPLVSSLFSVSQTLENF